MGIFSKSKAEPAQAVTDAQSVELDDKANAELEAQSEATESNALEQHIKDDDPAAAAALELSTFSLTPGAKSLLDRAMDNLSTNTGVGLEDPDAQLQVKQRAALIEAAGNDLSVVMNALISSCEDNPRDIAPAIYSMGYNVLKAAVFICNLDYRRYLDPRGDYNMWKVYGPITARGEDGNDHREIEGQFATDRREEAPSAPDGLDNDVDRQWHWLRDTYGSGVQDYDDVFCASLEDLRYFMQLTAESVGWDPERPMPFGNIMNEDGSFSPINDPMLALDNQELKRKEGQAKRRARESKRLSDAAAIARTSITGALRR